jgi:hypothetical protein
MFSVSGTKLILLLSTDHSRFKCCLTSGARKDRSKKRSTQHMGGDMEEDITKKALTELRGTIEGKERRQSRLISKLIGARCEVEDVLLSSSGSSILSSQERLRLCVLMAAIDNIVRRVEQCL